MTYFNFLAECGKRLINPDIALENELVYIYLTTRQDDLLIRVLDEDF